MIEMTVRAEAFALQRPFTISRGSRTEVRVVSVTLRDGGHVGRGECTPYARYGETEAGVVELLEGLGGEVRDGLDRVALQERLPAGGARSALDCAFWDLECKRRGVRIWELLGRPAPQGAVTMATVSLGEPVAMAEEAMGYRGLPVLKVKVGGERVLERVAAVHRARPDAELLVDANEAWGRKDLDRWVADLAGMEVVAIEQPLPAGEDAALAGYSGPVPLVADESCHTAAGLEGLVDGFQVVNVKLDKCGGLTGGLELVAACRARGLDWMVGCMMASSLACAPAMCLVEGARLVDLDCPVLLKEDRVPGLSVGDGGVLGAPESGLWG